MDEIQYEGLLGIESEQNKKLDAILATCKAKENQQVNQSDLKEDIEKTVHEKVSLMAGFIELKTKQQTENQTKILAEAINEVSKKIENLPIFQNDSFPPPKKIAFFGFEFLRTSVVIFILSVVIFWSLVMNIKQMDNYKALKTQNNQLNEYIQLQKTEKIEKSKVNKAK